MGIVLKRHNFRTDASFRVDLDNPKDLENLAAVIHELYPDRLFSFMRGLHVDDTSKRYGIDAIKEVFWKTPEGTRQHQLLRNILHTTFHHARLAMHRAWEETIGVFETANLTQLAKLLAVLDDFTNTQWTTISAHDLFSRLHVHALSLDALESLLRREALDTPLYAMRAKILDAARCLVPVLNPSLFVDRQENPEPYHRCDPNGQTIAHHIARGTLFPGSEKIVFDPQKDCSILALMNFAFEPVGLAYHTRLAREAKIHLTASP